MSASRASRWRGVAARRGGLVVLAAALITSLGGAPTARADGSGSSSRLARSASGDAPVFEPAVDSPANGDPLRGLVYGVRAGALLGVTPLTYLDAGAFEPVVPGWLLLGRFGLEVPSGFAFTFVVGAGGVAAQTTSHPPLLLEARVELRQTFELDPRAEGFRVRPFVAISAGFVIGKPVSELHVTFDAGALVGVELPLSPWASLEVGASVDVLAPGDVFADTAVFVAPEVGLGFRY